jgi:broad specificity phosphatase PhoE
MAVTRLFLVRHAEVEARYQNIFGGRIDMNLSPRGHEQARTLAAFLGRLPMDALYVSPMQRVQQTLAPWLQDGAPAPVTLAGLREVDFGDWTGLGWDAVKERFGHSAWDWLHCLERGDVPNGETGASFRARVEPCVQQIVREQPGRNVAIVCHGGVARMILAIVLGLPLPQTASLAVDYASVTRVALEPHRAELELLNFAPWRKLP